MTGVLLGTWAALVCVDYARTPLHLLRIGQAWDALRIWSGAPFSAAALADVLPGHLLSAAAAFLGLAAAWLAGAAPATWFRVRSAAVRLGLGLGVASLAMLGTGLAGLWRPVVCVAGAVVLGVAGARCRKGRRWAADGAVPPPRAMFPPWVAAAAAAIAMVSLAANVLGAMAPETGYDSLIQHLADARDALAAGRIFFNDLTFLAQHPAGVEMLYAWLLSLLPAADGDEAAKLVHAFLGVATAWAFRQWAVRAVAQSDATLLACVLYLTPFNGVLSGRAYVDLGLSFYSAAALAAPWGSWAQGAVLGFAVGAKYLGGFLLIGWVAALAFSGRRAGAWRVAVAASLFAGAWGVRNWLDTGNPVYPFAWGILGGVGWDARSAAEYGSELASYGRVEGIIPRLAIPWLACVHDKGALDDGSLGPLFLAAAPLLVLFGAGRGRERLLGWLVAFSWALWLVSPRQVRYALMILPVTMAAFLPGMRRASAEWPRGWKTATVLLPLVLVVNLELSFAAIYLWSNPVYAALGMESRGAYLARVLEPRDPGSGRSMYMALADWVPGYAGPGERVYMLGDAKVYHLPGRWRVNAIFNPPLLARAVRESTGPAGVAKRLHQRGISYVLYNVGGSIHIEYTHRFFSWTPREFAVLEEFFGRRMRQMARMDTTEGDPMYLLFGLEPGNWPDPPYLPGLDTRIAGVEEAAIRGLTPGPAELAARLAGEYPDSRFLRARLAPWLRRAGGAR